MKATSCSNGFVKRRDRLWGVLLSSMRLVKKWRARFQFKLRAPVFGDAAAIRGRMLDQFCQTKKKRADVHPL